MAKHRLNGTLKWIAALASLIGIIFLVGGKIWDTSQIASMAQTNSDKDEAEHKVFDERGRVNEKAIISIIKDIDSLQKDIGEVKSQIQKGMADQAAMQKVLYEKQEEILWELTKKGDKP